MKVDNRTPWQQSDITLMNARKKEKKIRAEKPGLKPNCPEEWDALGKHMLEWFKNNRYSKSIHDYASNFNYPPFRFKKQWAKESPIFAEYMEKCIYIVLARREKYLESVNKLDGLYSKQLPLYDLEYKELEDERINKETEASMKQSDTIFFSYRRTEELDKFLEDKSIKQKEDNDFKNQV